MYRDLEPAEVPFSQEITRIIEEFAASLGLKAESFYHDTARWIITDPYQEDVWLRNLQVIGILRDNQPYLCLIPCIYTDDHRTNTRTLPKCAPPELVVEVRINRPTKRVLVSALQSCWEACEKLKSYPGLEMTKSNLRPLPS